jgi:hypothetical protein
MYKRTNTESVQRISDGAVIPADEGNADYREYLKWEADGNTPEPYVEPEIPAAALIEREERATMLPRVIREFMLGFMEANATPAQLARNPGYVKVKALDDEIKVLRGKIK